jgi:hypothetical protein
MTFQARYPRLLAALVLVSSPLWFLPVILFQTLRYSGYTFRELGNNVRWAAESIFLDLSIEFGIALGRVREAYDASIGAFVTEARKRLVYLWQTGKLLATIGFQRTIAALSAFWNNQLALRLVAVVYFVLLPFIGVWAIYDACKDARLGRDFLDTSKDAFVSLLTGKHA